MFHELLVLETDLVDQLGVDDDPLMQRYGPRVSVGLRIVDGDLHVEMAEIGRRISSRTFADSVTTLPFQSIQVSSRSPIVSITSVSPDHFADEYPCHEGAGSLGNGRASVNTWRYPAFTSLSTTKR